MTTKTLTITILAPTLGSFSLTGVPTAVSPTQQMAVGLALSAPQPTSLSGSLTMTFTSSSAVPVDDPAVQFSTGSRIVNFTIPAGSTAAVFPTTVLLLTGTVTGTVAFTADVQNGPIGIPIDSIVIQPTTPRMTNVAAVRTVDGVKVQIMGYSPERRVISVEFGFDVITPAGAQRVNLSRSVQTEFDAWYRNPASSAFGSSFLFEQVFQVQGDPKMLNAVTVTLTNEMGSTSAPRAQIN